MQTRKCRDRHDEAAGRSRCTGTEPARAATTYLTDLGWKRCLLGAMLAASCDTEPSERSPVIRATAEPAGAASVPMGLATPSSAAAQSDSELDPNTPEDWIGYEMGLQPATRTFLGVLEPGDDEQGPLLPFGPNAQVADQLEEEVDPAADAEGTLSWIEIDSEHNVYRHEMSRADAWQLYEHMKALGLTSAVAGQMELGPGGDSEIDESAAQAQSSDSERGLKSDEPAPLNTWSNSSDSRVRMGLPDGFNSTYWPFKTIGSMQFGGAGGGCTGTMIGKSTVLTSAHCVWNGSTTIQHPFALRADNTDVDGTWDATTLGYMFPSGWFSESNCGAPSPPAVYDPDCFAHDIAVVRLDDDIGTNSGAMGFGAFNTTATEGYDKIYMRGYPACTIGGNFGVAVPKTPNNTCYWPSLYGHVNSQDCNVAEWAYGGCRGDGWYCTFDVSCDGSAGQSGSAFYSYETSLGNTPVALGVYSKAECCPGTAQQCTGALCTNNSFPNGVTRITPDIASWLAYWKSQWGG